MNTAVKWFGLVAMLALTMVAVANTAFALPVDVERVEINDDRVDPNSDVRFDLERDNELEIEVRLEASENLDNIELEAFISGYEYNDDQRVQLSARDSMFDMEAGVTYNKKVSFTLPDDMEQDDYKLRVMLSDRYGDATILNYNLKIEGARHVIKIMDVNLWESRVKAGSALLGTVRLENQGQNDEDDIRVKISVPELGITAVDYIDELDEDEQKNSEELYLRIPKCADAGIYTMHVDVAYDRETETTSTNVPFEVIESDSCAPLVQESEPVTTVVIQQPPVDTDADAEDQEVKKSSSSAIKTALEVILLVLIGLLVIVGIIVGISRMRSDDEE